VIFGGVGIGFGCRIAFFLSVVDPIPQCQNSLRQLQVLPLQRRNPQLLFDPSHYRADHFALLRPLFRCSELNFAIAIANSVWSTITPFSTN
jgi:hypothetical protein